MLHWFVRKKFKEHTKIRRLAYLHFKNFHCCIERLFLLLKMHRCYKRNSVCIAFIAAMSLLLVVLIRLLTRPPIICILIRSNTERSKNSSKSFILVENCSKIANTTCLLHVEQFHLENSYDLLVTHKNLPATYCDLVSFGYRSTLPSGLPFSWSEFSLWAEDLTKTIKLFYDAMSA